MPHLTFDADRVSLTIERMARPLRIIRLGLWYHITARGIERRPIFRDDSDNRHFLELLAELTERFGPRIHAYALMGNHYHLLVELSQPNLSRAIQWLNVSHSVWFNRRHRRCGYLFQGRYKSVLVDPVAWGLALSAYIHLNPVRVARLGLAKSERQHARAGVGELPSSELVATRLKALRTYRWTSYRAYIGLTAQPVWLCCQEILRLGSGRAPEHASRYRRYVEDQTRLGRMPSPWEELRDQMFLGGTKFVTELKKEARKRLRGGKVPRWLREPVTLEEVIAAVEAVKGEKWEAFKDRYGDGGAAAVLCLARKTTQMTLRDLAGRLQIKRPANITMSITRYERRVQEDRAERQQLERAATMLNVAL
jgi:putative transposase